MAVDRFPLHWPPGWPRTKAADRGRATFSKSKTENVSEKDWRTGQVVTRARTRTLVLSSSDAADRLERQIDALGGAYATLSTNQRLKLDGRPRQDQGEPSDPGAAVFFQLKGQDRCLACDKWNRVADNIAALAAHIDALRRIDRYGVGTLEQAFAGYQALPAKGQTWRTTLGFKPDESVDVAMIERAFRERARDSHPDVEGGSHDAMASLSAAKTEALKELS